MTRSADELASQRIAELLAACDAARAAKFAALVAYVAARDAFAAAAAAYSDAAWADAIADCYDMNAPTDDDAADADGP